MRWRDFALRARALVSPRRSERELAEELEFHLAMQARKHRAAGVDADEAVRRARLEFGNVGLVQEDARDARGVRLIDETARDLSYAWRVLHRNPGFAAAVVLTFALGIGCTSSIFSFVNAILLRPLPYATPERLVALWERDDARQGRENVVSVDTFDEWRKRTQSFSDIAALVPDPLTLDGNPAERLTAVQISPNYFRALGVRPAIGRDFIAADELNGGAPVAILSDAFWRARYGADRAIVGRAISLDGQPVTVIGVMGADFDPPRFGWIADQPIWLPFGATAGNRTWGRFLHVVARLRPGVTVEQAADEMRLVSGQMAVDMRDNKGWSALVVPLGRQITGDVRAPLSLLFAAVVLLMLMSTVNVTNLVATFTRGREHELAVRRAIGATRARLLRQQLAQAGLLGFTGAAIGVALAFVGTRALVALAPPSVPRLAAIHVNVDVLVFASLLAFVSVVIVGISSANAAPDIRSATRVTRRLHGSRVIAAELAIGIVLTVSATLMVRSLANLRAVSLGFDSAVVAGRVSLPGARYPDDARQTTFFDALVARVRALPGVTSASLVTSRPFACCAPSTPVSDPDQAASAQPAPITDIRYVDESYFSTMRIPVMSGAVFARTEPREGAVRIIVSRALAHSLWGNADPVGKRVSMALYGTTVARVIGVVGDVHLQDPRQPIRPAAYIYTGRFPNIERDIVVRGGGDAPTLLAALRGALAAQDPSVPLYRATSLDDAVADSFAADRFTTYLLAAFALLSLVLAAIGVYGVLSGDVNRRRQEIGIRVALGARTPAVLALVLRRAMRPTVIGTMVGVSFALVLARSMSALVFGVATWDPVSFITVTVTLIAVAVGATLIPAVRATRVSPVEVLRAD